ncbi:hypothetical protein [Roseburia sp. 1XD42-69]|uniref:hypothetical protein n=1 Tax=Roseburia sp. 1XD42-69 TaxID=2320088 RepID=UPI000EA17295|nr:hypothetical protein [Roseburia sp. 1XD42-69]RKJ68880.1 hypothetical protein D7Y06_01100 [Roseburia sp. 1XD42-69]
MRIEPKRDIEAGKYSTLLVPIWGTSTMTEADELEMAKDFPQVLRYADIEFKGKFIVTNGNPIMSDTEDAVEVVLDLNDQKIPINENLSISLELDYNKVSKELLDEKYLTTQELYTQAQIILFESKIKTKIHELLEIARSNVNDFLVTSEEVL